MPPPQKDNETEPDHSGIERNQFALAITSPETGPHGQGVQILRMVVDAIQECNLRCTYCHPGEVWLKRNLDVRIIRRIFEAANDYGLLEVVISGGEVTMHPQLDGLLDATHLLQRPTVTVITNATLLNPSTVNAIMRSNVTRIVVSVDGVDNETHGSARGKNLKQVLAGLRAVQDIGREITVVSVAHRGNFRGLTTLSRMLAREGLAGQHHYCAPSYSGTAREYYPRLRLEARDYEELQEQVDITHAELLPLGFFVAFNSFWPVTGRRTLVDAGRTITLQQLVEQQKDSLIHVRPDGEFRLAALSWGRATVGRSGIGNVNSDNPRDLMVSADALFRSDEVCQLPREVEAAHKFQINGPTAGATDVIIDSQEDPFLLAETIPVRRLNNFDLLRNPFRRHQIVALASEIRRSPKSFRTARHTTGIVMVFDRRRAHVTLLFSEEWNMIANLLAGESEM